jgi:hypothetical protein
MLVYNNLDHSVFIFCPLAGIPKNTKMHNVQILYLQSLNHLKNLKI